jgi:hypothetical protein
MANFNRQRNVKATVIVIAILIIIVCLSVDSGFDANGNFHEKDRPEQ